MTIVENIIFLKEMDISSGGHEIATKGKRKVEKDNYSGSCSIATNKEKGSK